MSDIICPKCNIIVNGSMDFVGCLTCKKSYHLKCSGLTKKSYEKYTSDLESIYNCLDCKQIAKQNANANAKELNHNEPDANLNWDEFFVGIRNDHDESIMSVSDSTPSLHFSENGNNLFDNLSFSHSANSNILIDTCMNQADTIVLLQKELCCMKKETIENNLRIRAIENLMHKRIREQDILNVHACNEVLLLKKQVQDTKEHAHFSMESLLPYINEMSDCNLEKINLVSTNSIINSHKIDSIEKKLSCIESKLLAANFIQQSEDKIDFLKCEIDCLEKRVLSLRFDFINATSNVKSLYEHHSADHTICLNKYSEIMVAISALHLDLNHCLSKQDKGSNDRNINENLNEPNISSENDNNSRNSLKDDWIAFHHIPIAHYNHNVLASIELYLGCKIIQSEELDSMYNCGLNTKSIAVKIPGAFIEKAINIKWFCNIFTKLFNYEQYRKLIIDLLPPPFEPNDPIYGNNFNFNEINNNKNNNKKYMSSLNKETNIRNTYNSNASKRTQTVKKYERNAHRGSSSSSSNKLNTNTNVNKTSTKEFSLNIKHNSNLDCLDIINIVHSKYKLICKEVQISNLKTNADYIDLCLIFPIYISDNDILNCYIPSNWSIKSNNDGKTFFS